MNKKIKIGNRMIGAGEPVFIIAEAGSNHDRKLSQAKKLIDVACESKVDAVKFQLFKAENFYRRQDPMFGLMQKNEFPREWLPEISAYARKRGLKLLMSPFDKEAVDLMVRAGCEAIKWASSETVNLPLLRYAAGKNKPLLISTGMCNLADIYEAVKVIKSCGNDEIVLLQCSSLYPTPARNVNLNALETFRNTFGCRVGFSDHTLGYAITLAAVAKGACLIEKHFTLSRKLKGPDHSYAIEPDELSSMVRQIREVEASFGSEEKEMLPEERRFARRESVLARKNIPKGTVIKRDMLEVARPALGIEPRFLNAVIGARAVKGIAKGEGIGWDKIKG